MTDTTFFIPTKAAFEHAFSVGAFAEADADNFMYMHTERTGIGDGWVDHFKHRDTRKYIKVPRSVYIAPTAPIRRPPVNNVHTGTEPGAKSAARIKEITEARTEFNRFEKCRDAAPQLLKVLTRILKNGYRHKSQNQDHGDRLLRADAIAACKAAGWTPGEGD